MRRLLASVVLALVLGGCGGYSAQSAERDVREYAAGELDARLRLCRKVDGGPEARHLHVFRCELLGAGERFRAFASAYPPPPDGEPKWACFVADDDTGVGFVGHGQPIPLVYPCGQVSG
jgi:hypothetical protein